VPRISIVSVDLRLCFGRSQHPMKLPTFMIRHSMPSILTSVPDPSIRGNSGVNNLLRLGNDCFSGYFL
jgi:hypothetical protein